MNITNSAPKGFVFLLPGFSFTTKYQFCQAGRGPETGAGRQKGMTDGARDSSFGYAPIGAVVKGEGGQGG